MFSQGKLLNYQRVVTQKECCNLFDCFNIQIGPPTYCTLTPNHHFRAPSLKEQMSNTTSTWLRLKTNDDEFLLHSSTSWDFEMRKFLNFSHRFRAGKSSQNPSYSIFSMGIICLWKHHLFGLLTHLENIDLFASYSALPARLQSASLPQRHIMVYESRCKLRCSLNTNQIFTLLLFQSCASSESASASKMGCSASVLWCKVAWLWFDKLRQKLDLFF